jgi:ubiquinone biosynthesis protein
MGVNVRTDQLKRYSEIAALLWKYGRSDLVKVPGMEASFEDLPATGPENAPAPEELAADLERMGPTFIKVGQMLSTRAELLPLAYLQALSRLQDQVAPFPGSEAIEIVASELGVRPSKAFAEFEEQPMAAASLAQVHRAVLRDGRDVVVKVQRPGIREQILADLEIFEQIASLAEKHSEAARTYQLCALLEEFRRSLVRELDYLREASHLRLLRENLADFDRLVVPAPIDAFTTARALTMERIHGVKIDKLSPLLRTELPVDELTEQLVRGYLHQILVDGFFHADPHPGNVLLTQDQRIALIDLGMVGHLGPGLQQQLLKLLIALTEGRAEQAAELVSRMGSTTDHLDTPLLRRRIGELVGEHRSTPIRHIQMGRVVLELVAMATLSGVRPPPELALLGKTLLNLDQVVKAIDPDLDVDSTIRRQLTRIVTERARSGVSATSLYTVMAESKELAEALPGRLNRFLETLAENKLRVHVDAIDEDELIRGFQKIANRIAGGVVVAALIIGAALMMRVQTPFTLLGYPGIAMIFFLVAAAGGFWMLWSILRHDKH